MPLALVVDDSASLRMVVRRILDSLGWDVAQAADGEAALRVIEERPGIQLALVDWNMPVMNGLELVRAVRANRALDSVKIMMVTTESEPDRIIAALDAGADEYVMKPFTADVLGDKLRLLGLAS